MSEAASEGLEIHKLDEHGAVARRINCLPGRITVLRSVHASESEMYEQALLGRQSTGRFTVLFRGAPYVAGKHNIIGAAPDFVHGDAKTVSQFLLACGAPEAGLERLLLDYALGGLSQAACAALGPAQQRALRLIAIPYVSDKVHVLVDPFEPLPEELREKFGRYISDFVAKKNGIVVVPRLNSRPEAWVENEFISRVQLERPRTKTVGFGSDAVSRAELLAHMRASDALNQPVPANPRPTLQRSIWALAGVVTCLALTGVVYFRDYQRSAITISEVQKLPEQAAASVSVSNEVSAPRYPAAIQEAVLKAFLHPDEVLQGQLASTAQISTQNLQATFYNLAPAAQTETNSETSQDESQGDIEARREEIRQRFLEAIARASNSQSDGTWGE